MTSKTHRAIGVMGGALEGLYNINNPIDAFINFIIILISSTLPDIDIKLGIKHRRATHSLLCTFIITLITYFIYPKAAAPFLIGYSLHIIADSLTISGVQFFYPYNKFFALKLFATGSDIDIALRYICNAITFFVFFYPLVKSLLSIS